MDEFGGEGTCGLDWPGDAGHVHCCRLVSTHPDPVHICRCGTEADSDFVIEHGASSWEPFREQSYRAWLIGGPAGGWTLSHTRPISDVIEAGGERYEHQHVLLPGNGTRPLSLWVHSSLIGVEVDDSRVMLALSDALQFQYGGPEARSRLGGTTALIERLPSDSPVTSPGMASG